MEFGRQAAGGWTLSPAAGIRCETAVWVISREPSVIRTRP